MKKQPTDFLAQLRKLRQELRKAAKAGSERDYYYSCASKKLDASIDLIRDLVEIERDSQ